MAQDAGERFRPQLELWPFPQRSGDFPLRFADADGREADVDATELARAIAEAGKSGDDVDWDTALGVARAAVAFLRHSAEPEPIALSVIVHTVERALRHMGLGRTARIYRRSQEHALATANDPIAIHRWDALVDADEVGAQVRRWIDATKVHPDTASELAAYIHERMGAAGLESATPALVREWVLSELLARGLNECAERIAHVSISLSDVEAVQRGEHGGAPSRDPAVDATAQFYARYAFSRVFPARVARAHLRGDLQISSLSDLCRFERVNLDLEGVKLHVSPVDEADEPAPPAPLTDPSRLARSVVHWTRALARHVSRAVRWNAVNFGYAPLVAKLDESDMVRAAYALFFETARGESADAAPATELELCWDAPESLAAVLRGANGVPVTLGDAFAPARRFFAAALEAIEGLSSRETSIRFAAVHLTLSPYFFGAPEASHLLGRIARTIANGFPLTLHYEPAQPLTLDGAAPPACAEFVAQTVTIDARRILDRAGGLNTALGHVESLVDDAVAAHLARHDHIVELARHRDGAFGELRRRWVDGPLLDTRALRYRVEIAGACDSLAPDRDDAAERLGHVITSARGLCDRWAASSGRAIQLAETGDSSSAAGDPRARLAALAQFHPYFDVPAPCVIRRDPSLAAPDQIADFIRWAFLYTPCRGLILR